MSIVHCLAASFMAGRVIDQILSSRLSDSRMNALSPFSNTAELSEPGVPHVSALFIYVLVPA